MKVFRADKRDFSVGDSIETAREYTEAFSKDRRKAERHLDKRRPKGMPSRSSCLFVFEALEPAMKPWSKMADGKLYEAEIDVTAILHRGDMALLDGIYSALQLGRNIDALIAMYWRGELSEAPEIEITVP